MKNSFLINALSVMLLGLVANTFASEEPILNLGNKKNENSKKSVFFNKPLPPVVVACLGVGTLSALGWMFKKAPQNNLFVRTSELCSMSPDAMRFLLGIGTGLFAASSFFLSKETAPGMKVVALHALAIPPIWGAANSRLLELAVRGIPWCSDADEKDIAPIATGVAFGIGNVGVRYIATRTGIYNFDDKV